MKSLNINWNSIGFELQNSFGRVEVDCVLCYRKILLYNIVSPCIDLFLSFVKFQELLVEFGTPPFPLVAS